MYIVDLFVIFSEYMQTVKQWFQADFKPNFSHQEDDEGRRLGK